MKILCIGRNYAEHARELNNAVPTEPVVFMKPDTCLLRNEDDFYIPDFSSDIHYECELVVKIAKNGKYIDEQFALDYIHEITVGIDFTARDIQQKQKEKGLPWEVAKAFDGSSPIGLSIPFSSLKNPKAISFSLNQNGKTVQSGNSADMIHSFAKIISYCSRYFTLKTGDLIYTGTPAGVGPVSIGDTLEAFLEGQKLLQIQVK